MGVLGKRWKQQEPRFAPCKNCGKDVRLYPSSISKKYCSMKCYIAKKKRPKAGKCDNCGKEFNRDQWAKTRRRKHEFCSRDCQYAYMRGAKHPLWRGNRRHDRGPTWKANQDLARKRDGNACQSLSCRQLSHRKEKASVDHIVPYRLAVKYGAQDGIDPNHQDNLICLCRGCHARKTQSESRLLRGDMIGFRSDMQTLIPSDRLEAALSLWGLGNNHQDSLLVPAAESAWMKKKKSKPLSTHCRRGHPFDRVRPDGSRYCSVCHREHGRRWFENNRERSKEIKRDFRKRHHVPEKVVPAKMSGQDFNEMLGIGG
jgi:hypothetical protein